MLTIRSCAAALALAVVGLAVQVPAHACDERVAGSCKPAAPFDAASAAARTEPAKGQAARGQAAKGQTAKGEAVAAASETRRSRRSARRAAARQRWSQKRIRFSQRSKSHRQSSAERRANRRYAFDKRTKRDRIERIEMDGRASPMELDEAMASTTAASTVAPMLHGAPTLESQFAPRSRTPMVATPAMKFADVGLGVPVLAQDGIATPPANATATLEAAKQRFVAAGMAHKQELQAATRVVTTAPEPPSDSATLRLTLVALAGLLALGTVVRLVIG